MVWKDSITSYAVKTLTSFDGLLDSHIFYTYQMKSFGEMVDPSKYKKIQKEINDEFPQPFIDKFNYMNNVPIYTEFKLPDTMSSFPKIIIGMMTLALLMEAMKGLCVLIHSINLLTMIKDL